MGFYRLKEHIINSKDIQYITDIRRESCTDRYFFEIRFINNGKSIAFYFDYQSEANRERNRFCKDIGVL